MSSVQEDGTVKKSWNEMLAGDTVPPRIWAVVNGASSCVPPSPLAIA